MHTTLHTKIRGLMRSMKELAKVILPPPCRPPRRAPRRPTTPANPQQLCISVLFLIRRLRAPGMLFTLIFHPLYVLSFLRAYIYRHTFISSNFHAFKRISFHYYIILHYIILYMTSHKLLKFLLTMLMFKLYFVHSYIYNSLIYSHDIFHEHESFLLQRNYPTFAI
jgi:hypothetical protein